MLLEKRISWVETTYRIYKSLQSFMRNRDGESISQMKMLED